MTFFFNLFIKLLRNLLTHISCVHLSFIMKTNLIVIALICNYRILFNFEKKHFEEIVTELRSRVSSLQTELDNSEKVQKDFVLLSQSLQQELEKIRGAETEVRHINVT